MKTVKELRAKTLMNIIEDLVRSAYGSGFRRILVLNGHGGNDPARARLTEVANIFPDLRVRWYSWYESHSVQLVAQKYDLKPYHGGWVEAFNFTRVADLPDGEKTPPHIPGLMGAQQARQVYGDGVFGGAYQANEAIMSALFSAALEDVISLLDFDH